MASRPPLNAFGAISALFLLSSAATAQTGCTVEDFESYPVPLTGSAVLSPAGTALDENTVMNGYGPALVEDGCVYSPDSGGWINWYNSNYATGFPSQVITATYNSGVARMNLDYDVSVQHVEFDLMTFAGFADTATVTAYNSQGVSVGSSSYVLPISGASTRITVTRPDIRRIVLEGLNLWSPILDNHEYCLTFPIFSVAVSGACAQPGASITGTYATPGGTVFVAYSFQSGSVVVPGGPCQGTLIGLRQPQIFATPVADPSGNYSVLLPSNTPPSICGTVLVQALDVTSCATTSVIIL